MYELTLDLLGSKDANGKALATCPTHGEGNNRALRIWRKADGGTVCKCFGGCDWRDVHDWLCSKLGIQSTEATPREVDEAEMKRRADLRRESEAKAERNRVRAVTRVKTVLKISDHVTEHGYLVKKGVQPTPTLRQIPLLKLLRVIQYHPKDRNGDKLRGDVLIVPVKCGDTFTSIEMIDGDGRKSALAGGEKVGGFWATQKLPDAREVLLVGEGVATCLSASQCSGYPAIATLSVSQLERVVRLMQARYPASKIVVLADLDKSGEPHTEAVRVSKEFDTFLGLPGGEGGCELAEMDFNDLHLMCGIQSVQTAIQKALEQKR
ncbi:toprim domain-containing protein [Paraburkholderia rhynchosiae]|uniref:toprim domain-containing protein n=1 Tax=Paraburkholderia rhynchosiae TaxID=487049 RepID=UPI001581B4FD|nr:toprim domain-containing protein [Paraburkholderia rhynchosiae]